MDRRTWLARSGALYTTMMLGPFLAISTPKPTGAEEYIRLNYNENPYGCSPKVLEAFRRAEKEASRYAFGKISELKKALADLHGLSSDHVMIGPGSSSLLEAVGQFMLQQGGDITSPSPTFDILPAYLEKFGRKAHYIPLKSDHTIDLKRILETSLKHPGLVYIVNPNNPIGTAVDPAELRQCILEASQKSYVLVDEAYLEFSDRPESMVSLVAENPKVIVVKTLSKIYGMAGLRIGYGYAHPDMVNAIEKFRIFPGIHMANTSFAAAFAGLEDQEHLTFIKSKNQEARQMVYDTLKQLSISYIPSQTSFILFEISGYSGDFMKEMESRNILIGVRDYLGKKWCRVSMGTLEEITIFTEALAEIWNA